jgi:hypothetical protein
MLAIRAQLRKSSIHGLGLFAKHKVSPGDIVWNLCPKCLILNSRELHMNSKFFQSWLTEHGVWAQNGRLVVLCGGVSLMNHSCRPNVRLGLDWSGICIRPVVQGDELTIDYRTFPNEPPFSFKCRCGVGKSAHWVNYCRPKANKIGLCQSDFKEKLLTTNTTKFSIKKLHQQRVRHIPKLNLASLFALVVLSRKKQHQLLPVRPNSLLNF